MLEQSRLSNQDKFILEIRLFEADRAVNEAETTFKTVDSAHPPGYGHDEYSPSIIGYFRRLNLQILPFAFMILTLATGAFVLLLSTLRKAL